MFHVRFLSAFLFLLYYSPSQHALQIARSPMSLRCYITILPQIQEEFLVVFAPSHLSIGCLTAVRAISKFHKFLGRLCSNLELICFFTKPTNMSFGGIFPYYYYYYWYFSVSRAPVLMHIHLYIHVYIQVYAHIYT